MSSSKSTKGYKFTIDTATGAVTSVYEFEKGRFKLDRIDSNETYTFDAATGVVTKTESEKGRLEITTFTDADGDGIFIKGSKSYASAPGLTTPTTATTYQNGYKFDVDATGVVTAVYEVKRGLTYQERVDANETFSFDAATGVVTKTEVEYGVTETVTFTDVDGDGIFSKASKTYTSTNGSTVVTWDSSHYGSDSDDRYNGGYSNDYYTGGLGSDSLYGNSGDDDLYGEEGHDMLSGGSGNDHLYGGAGDDTFFAGLGKDVLAGGAGNDVFKYFSINEAGVSVTTRDVIADFAVGDQIDLSAIDAVYGNRTSDAFKFIGSSANLTLANANGALWFDNGVVYGSTDRDLAAEFQIELTGITAVTAADFVL